jgi:2,6-dihydroxypseudooxynicotine hydrolase
MTATERDPRLTAALEHWAPRMIANGIDYNDFVATVGRTARWADWCAEWSKTAARHEELAQEAETRNSPISAGEAYARAALCYHFGKFVFFDDLAQLRAASDATATCYSKAASWLDPPAEPVAIPYAGRTLPGYLRRPRGVERPPVVLLLAGLDSVKEEFGTFEPLFHRRAMATLAFDGPGQGESEFDLPIEPAFEKPVDAVVDWLAGRDDVDATRVGAAGVSMGGYYAARVAAFGARLRAAVAIGGPYDMGELFDSVPSLTRQALEVRTHSPDLETARQRTAALSLKGVAEQIRLPFLVVFGRQDRLIPYQQAERLYAEIASPDKRLAMYDDGNHVCNNIPYAYRPLVADWLAERLG